MNQTFLPLADNAFRTFSENFAALVSLNYNAYGISQTVALDVVAKFDTYATALTAAQAPETRGPARTLAKNTAKAALVAVVRAVARAITHHLTVTDAQRQELGLTIRKKPAPVPAPVARPTVQIKNVIGRTMTINVCDLASMNAIGKPAGVIGAKVFTFVGTNYPTDPTRWAYNGDATRTKHTIALPGSVANGAEVWICAAWYNRKGETGPMSLPISTNIQGGGTSAVPEMKTAA